MKYDFTLEIGRMANGKVIVCPIREDIIPELLSCGNFFRITSEEDIEAWNEWIEGEWEQLDDRDYFTHEIPFVHTTGWYTYYNGYIYTLKNYIKRVTEDLKVAKDFSSKVAYMN